MAARFAAHAMDRKEMAELAEEIAASVTESKLAHKLAMAILAEESSPILAVEIETLRAITEAVDLAGNCCQPFDHHNGRPCSACWVQIKLLEKYPKVCGTGSRNNLERSK